MSLLRCAEHGYTLKGTCPTCGKATAQPGPAKYSPEDRYGAYRRKLKLMERERTGGKPAPAPAQAPAPAKVRSEPAAKPADNSSPPPTTGGGKSERRASWRDIA